MLSEAAVLAAKDRFCFIINADQSERVKETLEGLLTSRLVVEIKRTQRVGPARGKIDLCLRTTRETGQIFEFRLNLAHAGRLVGPADSLFFLDLPVNVNC